MNEVEINCVRTCSVVTESLTSIGRTFIVSFAFLKHLQKVKCVLNDSVVLVVLCERLPHPHLCCQCLSGLTVIRQESRVTKDASLFLPFYPSSSFCLCLSVHLIDSDTLSSRPRPKPSQQSPGWVWLVFTTERNINNTDIKHLRTLVRLHCGVSVLFSM